MFPLIFSLLFLLGTGAVQAQPRLLWEARGFEAPESVLYDADRGLLYVSNVNGQPTAKDGNGYISRLRPDGTLLERRWIQGLDAPKGMALAGDRLYVTDIDHIAVIDPENGRTIRHLPAAGARFLNDAAAGADGAVYFSDMQSTSIWRLKGGRLEEWFRSDNHRFCAPNGLLVEGERLIVACWSWSQDEFEPNLAGHLKSVDLKSRKVSDLGKAREIGRLDGIESDGRGGWFVTDWVAGVLFHVDTAGATPLLQLETGSADLGISANHQILYIPLMQGGVVRAYSVSGTHP